MTPERLPAQTHKAYIRARWGDKYRVRRGDDDIDQIVLRGERGHIYMHGKGVVAAHITNTWKPGQTFAAIQSKVPTATLHASGHDELIVLCPLDDWRKFFSACHARTKKTLSAEHKAKLLKAGRPFRKRPGSESAQKPELSTIGGNPLP